MKIQKVFKDGVYLWDVYPHANWFQVVKYRIGQLIGQLVRFFVYWLKLGLTASVAMALGAFIFGNYTGATTSIIMAEQQAPLKIEELKEGVVNQIASLESGNSATKDALIVFDDNSKKSLAQKDKASIGCMQFKVSTVQLYEKQLYGKDMSNYDATLLALNCDQAKGLAKDVIFNIQGGLWNWSVATKEMGTKVEIIRQLEK